MNTRLPLNSSVVRVGSVMLALTACAPETETEATAGGYAPIPDNLITEGEQAAGVGEPGNDYVEPYDGIDGNVASLAPRLDDSTIIQQDGDTAVHVDALTACRPATGYSGGNPKQICVTTVDGKLVEYRTAEAFVRMRTAAARQGVHISVVSGFRTMDQQRYLYNCYLTGRCNNGNLAARPGYSNHQSGLALDLNTSASGVYNWLTRNGSTYGFRRTVPSEIWHWERPAGSQGPVNNSGGSSQSDGSCFSSTLNRSMPQRACVQSRADSQWYQCRDGAWRDGRGTQGACNGTHSLGTPAAPPAAQVCFSATTNRNQPVGACVQGRIDRLWYQCTNNGWVHTNSLPGGSGPAGACSARFPL